MKFFRVSGRPRSDVALSFPRATSKVGLGIALCVFVAVWLAGARGAKAAPAAPGWSITASSDPTVFSSAAKCVKTPEPAPGSCDHYTLRILNVGAVPISGTSTITVGVPAGVTVVSKVVARTLRGQEPLNCVETDLSATCTYEGEVQPFQGFLVEVPVEVDSSTPSGRLPDASIEVTGGGASEVNSSVPTFVDTPLAYGIAQFQFQPSASDGSFSSQAGGRPFSLSSGFDVNSFLRPVGGFPGPAGVEDPKSGYVDLPVGFIGDPLATPQCGEATLQVSGGEACPTASRIGYASVTLQEEVASSQEEIEVSPLYNIIPEAGFPAQFGFLYHGKIVILYASVVRAHVPGGYTVRVGTSGIPSVEGLALRISGVHFTFFGNPSAENGGQAAVRSFLTNSTDCSDPEVATVESDSWPKPLAWASANTAPYYVNGCESLQFRPQLSIQPEVQAADSPSGYQADLTIPQSPPVPSTTQTPHLRQAVVRLPAGVVLSPSAANGLAACPLSGPAGINLGSSEFGAAGQDVGDPEATELGAGHTGGNASPYDDGVYHAAAGHCPSDSELGTAEVVTPLLAAPLTGKVFLAEPLCGHHCSAADAAAGNLYGIYVEVEGSGVVVKLRGRVSADPETGTLTASFDDNPQLPFEKFRLRFRGGAAAPLANPLVCGAYETQATLTPWSSPQTPAAESRSLFSVSTGSNGAPCAVREDDLTVAATFEGGSASSLAGTYAPLLFRVARPDGSQRMSSVDVTLPTGELASLRGVAYCPEASIGAAVGRSGSDEIADPSCPAGSRIGTATVGVGPGERPFYAHGSVYLAGPYKGAPLSAVVITPAVAGPFDLGTVAVRAGLAIDPITSQASIMSDSLPTILDGTPLDIRSIFIRLDRPKFSLNPTSCAQKNLSASLTSTLGPVDSLQRSFQVGGCNGLPFRPKLSLQLKGSPNRGKNPALRALLVQSEGQANLKRVSVVLPRWEFIDNRHINNPCTRVQFAAGAGNGAECPASSILGRARAFTPLLDKPLEGPVYFRSNGGERELPDLVASLDGQVHLNVIGFIDSVHQKGSEASRVRTIFAAVPDAPVSRFVLELRGGDRGLLQNSANLCKVKDVARANEVGQNGAFLKARFPIAKRCSVRSRKKSLR